MKIKVCASYTIKIKKNKNLTPEQLAAQQNHFINRPIQESGLLNVGISYDNKKNELELTILNVENIPTKDRGAPPIIQVRILLLPARNRRWKSEVQNTDTRIFNEVFRMQRIKQTDLDKLGIRFRLYGIGKVKDRLIGEAVIDLGELNLPQYFEDDGYEKLKASTKSHSQEAKDEREAMNNERFKNLENSDNFSKFSDNQPTSAYTMEIPENSCSSTHVNLTLTIKLDPRANLIDKPSLAAKQEKVIQQGAPKEAAVIYNSSLSMIKYGGESPQVLIGLSYNAQTGRLCLQIIKGSHFGDRAFSNAPHTFVRLTLLDKNLNEVSRSKTTIRESTPNPVFREKFFFEVAHSQLNNVTITARVMRRPSMIKSVLTRNKKNLESQNVVGWITMGNHNSDYEQKSHWEEMARARGQEVCRWHTLLDEESLQ